MNTTKLHIKMSKHGRGEVFINGEKVAVKSASLSVGVDQVNVAHLTIIPDVIEVEGVFDVSTIESSMREYGVGEPK